MSEAKHTWKDLVCEQIYEDEAQSKIKELENLLFGDDAPVIDYIVFAASEDDRDKFLVKAREDTQMLVTELREQIMFDLWDIKADIDRQIPTAINDLIKY